MDVEDLAAAAAGSSACQPLEEHIEIHVHEDSGIQRRLHLGQQTIQRFGLRNIARKSVQDKTAGSIRLNQPLANDAQHDVVSDQLAVVHGRLRLQTEIGAPGYRVAEKIAGGDLRVAEVRYQFLGLSALARAGRPHKYDAHDAAAPLIRLVPETQDPRAGQTNRQGMPRQTA